MVSSMTHRCDAFSTMEEHHDKPTNSRSGGRPPAHPEKLRAPHHRLSAGASELDRLDGSSHVGHEHRGRRQGGKLYALPIVLSTVNVKTGANAPTIHQLAEVLAGIDAFDRTTINAWEDEEFVTAVKATGRKKLIMTALWTEACLSFPALDALREGYEVYPVVDAVGGTSVEAHRAALERLVQAGAHPTSWVQMLCELQRDWSRKETAQPFAELVFAVEGR